MSDQQRPETGPMAFGSDWPGVFVRGDDAMGLAIALGEALAVLPADALAGRMALERAIALMSSCLCRGGLPEGLQPLRAWRECQPEAAASKEGEQMTRWEYLMVEVHCWTDMEKVLDGHGRDGWELVSVMKFPVGEIRMVLKRPLVEGE